MEFDRNLVSYTRLLCHLSGVKPSDPGVSIGIVSARWPGGQGSGPVIEVEIEVAYGECLDSGGWTLKKLGKNFGVRCPA